MKSLDKEKLLQEIREKGIEINNIDDLKKIDMSYSDIVPIILKYLLDIEDESDKDFLVRCLGVKGFRDASIPLINEFYKSHNLFYKWAIGNSLAIIQDDTIIDELVKIALEKEHGIARQMIVHGLGYFKEENVKLSLIELLDDEEVVGHAIFALSQTGDYSLIKYIRPFEDCKVNWIKKEASKAISRLNKYKLNIPE